MRDDLGHDPILAWLLARHGVLEFDAPVTAYWPGFGGGDNKSAVPVRYLFTRQVGLPYLDQQLSRGEVPEGSRIGRRFSRHSEPLARKPRTGPFGAVRADAR